MYNISDFGAVADGKTLNTEFIQKAIDVCYENGGGRVTVPAGVFVTGTIYLKSNVELHISHNAVLKASDNLDDYNETNEYPENQEICVGEEWVGKHLIIARKCENVAIIGTGTIDGAGDTYFCSPKPHDRYIWRDGLALAKDKEKLRPGQLICFILSNQITVSDITIRNMPCWGCFFHGCNVVSVKGLKVFNLSYAANTDGIDIDCCKYVTISDCIIDTGDDAIAIRCDSKRLGVEAQACEFIAVSNCVLGSSSSVFRIGVGVGEIRHIRISDIVITRGGAGATIQTSFNGNGAADISDINISNVSAVNVSFPFEIYSEVGSIRHLTLQNMRFEAIAAAKVFCNHDESMENVLLKEIDIFIKPETTELTDENIERRGRSMLSLSNVKGARLNNVRIFSQDSTTWRDKAEIVGCDDISIENCLIE